MASSTPSVPFNRKRAVELVIGPDSDPDELRDYLAQALTEIERLWDALADIADPLSVPFQRNPERAVFAFQAIAVKALSSPGGMAGAA